MGSLELPSSAAAARRCDRARFAACGLAVLLGLAGPAAADPIDDYLRGEMARRKIPGLALAVARDGRVERISTYGLAHVETQSPVGADSIFAIASLDKQVTACGVLRATELGKLALDDAVTRWVEVPFAGVTLGHLLSHTSGLPDEVAGSIEGRFFTDYTSDQLLATVAGLTPLAPPGHRFAYSDAGLFLAQLATERAAGEPWWDFMRRELFAPAGMASPLSMAPRALIPHRVSAYTISDGGELVRDRRLDLDFGPLYSDLGMTVGDFARFLAAQDLGRPLAPASVARLTTPTRLADGAPASELFQWSRYGLGVGLDSWRGEPITLHSGHSGVGFARFPVRRLSVVVFTNLEHPAGSDPVGLALGVAGLLEGSLAVAPLPALPVAPAELAEARAEYAELLAGRPELTRYATRFSAAAWDGAGGLAGRAPRLGALEAFELLDESPVDGAATRLWRARHADGTIYWRVSRDAAGKIDRAVWWHL